MSLEVDDTDRDYAYTSGWAMESSSSQFGGTSHCTSTDGASVTLRFRGKYIIVYATVPTSTSPTFSDSTRIDLQLDGGSIIKLSQRALPGPIYSHPIFESSGLPETDHTLKLTFVDRPDTTRFCLDRIGISSDIGSSYVPELFDPFAQGRGMVKRDFDPTYPPTLEAEFVKQSYTYRELQLAALAGAAFGGFLVAVIILFKRSWLRPKRALVV